MQALLNFIFAPRQLHAAGELAGLFRQLFSLDGLKRASIILLTIFEIFGVILFDAPRTPRGPQLDLTGYSVVFEDDFSAGALNLDVWEYRGTGTSSSGRKFRPEQVRVENGKLILRAEYKQDGPYGPGFYNAMCASRRSSPTAISRPPASPRSTAARGGSTPQE